MKNLEYIPEIYDKIDELHGDNFYSGKKRKETSNLLIGTILGICLSIFAGSLLSLISNFADINRISLILANNQSLNLSSSDIAMKTIELASFQLNKFYFLSFALLSGMISYMIFVFQILNNKSLLESRRNIKYEITNKWYSLNRFVSKFTLDFHKIVIRNFNNKNWRLKVSSEGDNFKIMVYHKYKRWISEKVNFILINRERMSVIYSTSICGEMIAKYFFQYIQSLEENKILSKKRSNIIM